MNEPSQSDTPRTDAEFANYECLNPNITNFARTLERELTTERAARTKVKGELAHANSTLKFLDATHDQLSHDLTTLRATSDQMQEVAKFAEAKAWNKLTELEINNLRGIYNATEAECERLRKLLSHVLHQRTGPLGLKVEDDLLRENEPLLLQILAAMQPPATAQDAHAGTE